MTSQHHVTVTSFDIELHYLQPQHIACITQSLFSLLYLQPSDTLIVCCLLSVIRSKLIKTLHAAHKYNRSMRRRSSKHATSMQTAGQGAVKLQSAGWLGRRAI